VRGLSRRPNFELRHYRLVSSHHARPSSARSDRLPSLVPCGFRRQVREPRAAGPKEILPSLACGQRREDVGQGDVGPEPRLKPVTAQLLARPQRSQSMRTTSKGNSPIGCEPMRFIAARRPGSSISLACDLCASAARSRPEGDGNGRQGRALEGSLHERARPAFVADWATSPARSAATRHRYAAGPASAHAFPGQSFALSRLLAHSRTKADARAIGLRKQKIGKWRQAAVPNPS
jgi:hypothetical protein